jgi:hypothetical protein
MWAASTVERGTTIPEGRGVKVRHGHHPLAVGALVVLLAGCAPLSTKRLADNLTQSMLGQSDPEIVRAGAPAYLLLIDSLLEDAPDDTGLLLAGARLYDAYGSGLVQDPERRRQLTAHALDYAQRALCLRHRKVCEARGKPYPEFAASLPSIQTGDLSLFFTFASAWAGWIQARSDDWGAIADLPKAELVLERVVEAEPGFEHGRAQLYLGVMRSLVPPALGGRPERAREHFELAIAYSQGRDLIAKVEYARDYARLMFDQALHDRLLNEVLQADPEQPGLTLSNVLAQRQARELLDEGYF